MERSWSQGSWDLSNHGTTPQPVPSPSAASSGMGWTQLSPLASLKTVFLRLRQRRAVDMVMNFLTEDNNQARLLRESIMEPDQPVDHCQYGPAIEIKQRISSLCNIVDLGERGYIFLDNDFELVYTSTAGSTRWVFPTFQVEYRGMYLGCMPAFSTCSNDWKETWPTPGSFPCRCGKLLQPCQRNLADHERQVLHWLEQHLVILNCNKTESQKCQLVMEDFIRALPIVFSKPRALALVTSSNPLQLPFLRPLMATEEQKDPLTWSIFCIAVSTGWFGRHYKLDNGGGRTYGKYDAWVDIMDVHR
jgi:hypothetical protein